jgi:hypothetical protein
VIEIEKVEFRHYFPTIDFKFLNGGRGKALLWRFAISVTAVEVDPTPELEFSFRVPQGQYWSDDGTGFKERGDFSLVLLCSNNGWGPARELEGTLEHPILNQLLSDSARRFGEACLSSGEHKEILVLEPGLIKDSKVEEVYRRERELAFAKLQRTLPEFLDMNRHMTKKNGYEAGSLEKYYEEYKTERSEHFEKEWGKDSWKIPLEFPKFAWRCLDAHGVAYSDLSDTQEPYGIHRSYLYLTPRGFEGQTHFMQLCALGSDTTYCVIIDPDRGNHQREYRISRAIPPNDVERFHILIGASKSCNLTVKFTFSLDHDTEIHSQPFVLKIRNPRGSDYHYKYKDGDELRRDAKAAETPDRAEAVSLRRSLEDLRGVAPEYPFLSDSGVATRRPFRVSL